VYLVCLVESLSRSTEKLTNRTISEPIMENTLGGQQRTIGFFPKLEMVLLISNITSFVYKSFTGGYDLFGKG